MKKEIQYANALPQMPEAFYKNMTETLKELEEPMKKRYKAVTILVAALIVALMMAGVAFAAMQVVHSGLLDRLFPKGAPSEAEKMVVSDALSNERDGLKLTMNEHLYDGRNIHLDWTVESARDDTVYYLTNYQLKNADGSPLTISQWSSYESNPDLGGGTLTALNLTLDGITGAKAYSGIASFGFMEDEVPKGPWTFTLDVYAYTTDLTPVAVNDPDELSNGQILQLSKKRQLAIQGCQFGSINRYPEYVAVHDASAVSRSYSLGVPASVKAHDTCGLLKPLTHLSVTINLDPGDASNLKIKRLPAPQTLTFGDLTIHIEKLEFDLAGIHTSYIVPLEYNEPDGFVLSERFLILDQDGTPLNDALTGISGSWSPVKEEGGAFQEVFDRHDATHMRIDEGGGSVSKQPDAITLIWMTPEIDGVLWRGGAEKALEYANQHPEQRMEANLALN
jgi:hypothetical protein